MCRVGQAHVHTPACGDFSQYAKQGIKLAVWHPGGNWGDIYYSFHKSRMHTFGNLLKNGFTVVGFPQSMHFADSAHLDDDSALLRREIEKSGVSTEDARKRIILTWRQKNSYETALRKYGFVQNILVPDIAQCEKMVHNERFLKHEQFKKKSPMRVFRANTSREKFILKIQLKNIILSPKFCHSVYRFPSRAFIRTRPIPEQLGEQLRHEEKRHCFRDARRPRKYLR